METRVLPKAELRRIIKKFLLDKNRGISVELFAELCGVNYTYMRDVFIYETENMSEHLQRRVSKGYMAWARGEVAVMQNRDRTKFVDYRKEAKPRLVRSTGLQVVNGEIKIRVGITNRNDYSTPTLDEQLERG
ncbi:hypothetical protein [Bacteriophage sp.]|nr:hypothetical protein [Bacteriophage sp.]